MRRFNRTPCYTGPDDPTRGEVRPAELDRSEERRSGPVADVEDADLELSAVASELTVVAVSALAEARPGVEPPAEIRDRLMKRLEGGCQHPNQCNSMAYRAFYVSSFTNRSIEVTQTAMVFCPFFYLLP